MAQDDSHARAHVGEAKDTRLARLLEAYNASALAALDAVSATISHPGESGKARERVLTEYLAQFIPAAFGLDTGFVIDVTGAISKQIDLVVYRRDYHPVLRIGGLPFFMVESVMAVAEVKATMASADALNAALLNIASVKRLDRTAGGTNVVLAGSTAVGKADRELFSDQVFGVLLTESSLSPVAFHRVIEPFLASRPRREWPNFYADVRAGCWSFLADHHGTTERLARPDIAKTMALEVEGRSPLARIGFEILNFLRIARLIDYSPVDYLDFGRRTPSAYTIDVSQFDSGPRDDPERDSPRHA